MSSDQSNSNSFIFRDVVAGLVVFLVALPLCLGVAFASGAPLFSGLVSGILGGIVVGALSKSHTSVSGPAAGLTAIVAEQIAHLGFEAFLVAVLLAGALQIIMGILRMGSISAFFPSSVIRGLLAAIGVILILKQFPHVLGHDTDPEGDMAFFQIDEKNTFTEILALLNEYHLGAAAIGLISVAIMVIWDRIPKLKKSPIPSALIVVVVGITLAQYFRHWGGYWLIEGEHLVLVPVSDTWQGMRSFIKSPDFAALGSSSVYFAAITLAIVASLETLLNLEAVEKIDPKQRSADPNRELLAQGTGNICSAMLGGLPMTSVIVRSSANINAGGQTKLATLVHGALLLICVVLLPTWLNQIPISCLAAILLVTGYKLVSPKQVNEIWLEGKYQFIPFLVTVVAIVLTDLLIGILIGLGISISFILSSNIRRPLRRIEEKHIGGDVTRVELASQVSFLNRAALDRFMNETPTGSHILFDASNTDYIDPDVLSMLKNFKNKVGPGRGIQVSMKGFREKYSIRDDVSFIDYSTRELQEQMTPQSVLEILRLGNERFRTGRRLRRDVERQIGSTAVGQHPLAVVLSCIDSRTPSEIIFDLGLGDIFSVRVAGNVVSPKVLGSIEFGCAMAGAKLVLVIGHTRCGAVGAAVHSAANHQTMAALNGCDHLDAVVKDIQRSFTPPDALWLDQLTAENKEQFITQIAENNVRQSTQAILRESKILRELNQKETIAVVGAMYDVSNGEIRYL